jgi:hypothetical protein
MPRVPTYDNLTVADRPLSGARQESIASPGLLGGGNDALIQTGRALQGVGNEAAKIAGQMQDTQNADMLFRAETTLKNEYLGFENTVRERRGQSAWGATDEARQWWDKKARETMDGLENDAQRKLFMRSASRLREQSLTSISHHEADQRRASLTESAQASIVGSINLAASQVGTPTEMEAISGARTEVVKRLQVLQQLQGWDAETYKAKEAEQLTKLHLQVIQNKVDKDPKGARDYFALNRAEINGTALDGVEKLLKTGGLKVTAQTFADEVDRTGLTEADAIKAAREKFEGEEEAAVVTEIKTRFSERTQARERMQRDAADEAFGIYARTGSLNAIPSTLLAKMDGKTLLALRKDARDAAEGKAPKTDWDRYYLLRNEALTNPEQFARRDLRAEFPHLGKAERESLIDLQTKKPADLKEVATLENQLGNAHNLMGWGGSNNAEKRGMFDTAVQQAVLAEEKATGKKLGYEGRQKIIDRLLIEGDTNGWLPMGNKRLFEVQGTEAEGRFAPVVPDAERSKITAALKRAGKPVSETEIVRLFKQKHGLK